MRDWLSCTVLAVAFMFCGCAAHPVPVAPPSTAPLKVQIVAPAPLPVCIVAPTLTAVRGEEGPVAEPSAPITAGPAHSAPAVAPAAKASPVVPVAQAASPVQKWRPSVLELLIALILGVVLANIFILVEPAITAKIEAKETGVWIHILAAITAVVLFVKNLFGKKTATPVAPVAPLATPPAK